jgi:AraC-like DNA-binding protein
MLFYKDDICVFFGSLNPIPHSHHAIEISIGEEAPVALYLNGGKPVQVDACVILPDQKHQIVIGPGKGEKITIMIDAGLPVARNIEAYYKQLNKKFDPLPKTQIDPFRKAIIAEKKTALTDDGDRIFALVHQLIAFLFPEQVHAMPPPMNDKIDFVTKHVRQNIRNNKFRFKELADKMSLSESRLSHLFKSETGIPFRKYVLWTRLKTAVEAFQDGNNITQASYISGFADSSHFCKVYTEMFGLKPSLPLREYQKPTKVRAESGEREAKGL